MNKKQLVVGCIVLFLSSLASYAAEDNDGYLVAKNISNLVFMDMNADLEKWTDPEIIKELSNVALTDDSVKRLYSEFKNTIVNPPDPETYEEYSIPNAEESLAKVTQLGRRIHNMGLAISEADMKKYGNLLQIMRDVLYLDSKHIPLAIKHDNSRDVFWYELHTKWTKNAEDAYTSLFTNEGRKRNE